MYVPKINQLEDRDALLAYMRAYSFAPVATSGAGGLMATHLPFIIEEEGGRITLLAHMAKANPQWRDFAAGVEASPKRLESAREPARSPVLSSASTRPAPRRFTVCDSGATHGSRR